MLGAEEMLRGSQSVRAFAEVVVYHRQGPKPARPNRVQVMMPKGELPISSLHTGAGTLEEMGTFGGDAFDVLKLCALQAGQWTVRGLQRCQQGS